MNHYTQTIALAEMSLSCATVIVWFAQQVPSSDFHWLLKVLLVVLIGNLFYWPLGLGMELPLAAYVRGATGDLSILSLLFLWSSLLPEARPVPLVFKVLLALIALIFYPFALGVGMIDPYAWGYGHLALLIGVLLVALVCGLCNWIKGVWIIGFAIIAWAVQWHESANLWDYLLDPFLAIWALVAIIKAFNQNRKMKARSGYLFRPG
jgi:hypothetical protein